MRIIGKAMQRLSQWRAKLYLVLRTILPRKKHRNSGNILILHGGNIGDGLLHAPAVIALKEYYTKQGKRVFYICPRMAWKVISMLPEMAGIQYIDALPVNRLQAQDIQNVLAAVRGLRFETTIVFSLRGWQWKLLAVGITSGKMYSVEAAGTNSFTARAVNALLSRHTFMLPGESSACVQKRDALLVRSIGAKDYKIYIPHIPPQCEFKCTDHRYIVVTADSSITERRWPADRFIELVNYLLKRTDCDVVLTGNNLADELKARYATAFSRNRRVIDLVNKTNLEQWIEVIRGGEFLVGNDSGSIHIAAMVGTQAFCLTGAWDGRLFVPYQIEKKMPDTAEPICLWWEGADRESLPCYDCFSRGSIGEGNEKCEKLLAGGGYLYVPQESPRERRGGGNRKLRSIDLVGRIQRRSTSLLKNLYLTYRCVRPVGKGSYDDRVLIVQGATLGDALLNASAVAALAEHYTHQGKKVYLLCARMVSDLLKMVPGLDEGQIVYIDQMCGRPISFHDLNLQGGLKEAKRWADQFASMEYDTVIGLLCRSRLLALGAAGIKCYHMYFMDPYSNYKGIRGVLNRAIFRRCEKVQLETEDISRPEQGKQFLNSLGISGYHTKMPVIAENKGCIAPVSGQYITVTLDSSSPARRWPEERFIELIHRLLKEYDYKVVLTGTDLLPETEDRYRREFGDNERVVDLIRKTSLQEWVELLRGSRFHIGVDSGSIHVAAAVGTQAFCLAGVWDRHRFFPYKFQEMPACAVQPVCIYRDDVDADSLPCYGCTLSRYMRGNLRCLLRRKMRRPYLCLEHITVDNVINVVVKFTGGGCSVVTRE